jgi:hypothetical protein
VLLPSVFSRPQSTPPWSGSVRTDRPPQRKETAFEVLAGHFQAAGQPASDPSPTDISSGYPGTDPPAGSGSGQANTPEPPNLSGENGVEGVGASFGTSPVGRPPKKHPYRDEYGRINYYQPGIPAASDLGNALQSGLAPNPLDFGPREELFWGSGAGKAQPPPGLPGPPVGGGSVPLNQGQGNYGSSWRWPTAPPPPTIDRLERCRPRIWCD